MQEGRATLTTPGDLAPRSLVALAYYASPRRRIVTLGLAVLAIALVSVVTLSVSRNSDYISAWWPAAGLGVVTALMARGTRVSIALLIWVTASGSRIAVGESMVVAILYGFVTALEAWIVAALIDGGRGAPPSHLTDVSSVVRFLIAVAVGTTTMGVLTAVIIAVGGGDAVQTFLVVVPSHASAIVVIAPVFLLARIRPPRRLRPELVLQALLLAGVLCIVFWPGTSSQIKFLTLPLLVWAALRFGTRVAAWQMLTTALTATGLKDLASWAGFESASSNAFTAQNSSIIQSFFIVYAATVLVIGASREERLRLVHQVDARNHLLRGGIVGSHIGLLLLEEDALGAIRVIDGNEIAARLLGVVLAGPLAPAPIVPQDGPLAEAILRVRRSDTRTHDWSGEVEVDSGTRRLQVFVARIRSGSATALLTVQVIDMTARYAAATAVQTALENEQATTQNLRELNRQKEDFVSSVTHELRTPITSILGYSEELQDTALSPIAADYVSVIARNANRLATLVEDLLELARLSERTETTLRSIEIANVDVAVTNCIEELGATARSHGVTLEAVVPAGSLEAIGRERDVARVLTNLVANALKFTPRAGHVVVECSRVANTVQIDVIDNGIGIPPAEIHRVLERFYRSSTSVLLPGTGLGLSIVTGLVSELRGTLELTSDGTTGTRVRVTLPAHVRAAAS
ncbi:ATP-binding protein [Cryobacterium sp. CG_9.6]|uniref:sensor histidine kinase n=1 Tax=Cryobacterium sp. CG_9.6 TaxID=2760710 RepID=UPI002473D5BB|nr:ATP-binding protein [Cryobacterium sp. CG_9.6]MDH6235881.1 signal transduction histidine kinase [Cryobacterium sp. CG_9.6]